MFKINFSKIIDLAYLFDPDPSFSSQVVLRLLIVFSLMFLLGMFTPFFLPKTPPWLKLSAKIFRPLLTFSLIGFCLLFFHWQTIPYFSSRILLLILLMVILIWAVYLLKYLNQGFKKELVEYQRKLQKVKYFYKTKKELQRWLRKKQ